MRIGIDARAAAEEPAGRGRVVRELLRALARREDDHRYELFARQAWDGDQLDERFSWTLIPGREPRWNLRAARAASRRCDVFLSSNSYLTVGLLRIPSAPIVYDLVTFDRRMRPSRRSAAIERMTLGLAVRRAARVLAISEATAADIVARFPQLADRIVVSPLGASEHLSTPAEPELAALGLPEEFVLTVGTLEPRKNLPRLIAAHAELPPGLRSRYPLVVAGRLGWQTAEILRAIEDAGDHCRWLGCVSDEVLAVLYDRCAAFCFPSLGEGFGLPVAEALAAGAPVITSDRPSLREVAGEAAVYVDPTSTVSIATALQTVLADQSIAKARAEQGRQAVARYDWAHTASVILATLESLVPAVAPSEESAPTPA